ncbi:MULTISPECIES: hypothetical protein [unclassified Myroides]|uniref:hypothetical protein n=1 Tax=unclassified Myroides TaxID=2642485 RepID=UPI003D2F940B
MLDSISLKLESLRQDDYFDEFLVLLEKESERGRDYISLSTIPVALHYRLIQEGFCIKRVERIITRCFFWKKNTYYYKVERLT